MVGDEGRMKIRLFCPAASKMIDWVAWKEQPLDLGSISGALGLEPWTVKLNGHFISRGIDLVSSCVTWRSLLAFFSAKGLSTGKDDGDALIVQGKLSKVGAKRAHYDPRDTTCSSHPGSDFGLIRNKKFKYQSSETDHVHRQEDATVSPCNGIGFKRKHLLEDGDSLKKLRLNTVGNSGRSKDVAGTQGGVSSSSLFKPFNCSFFNGGLKRTREDEVFGAASCKRIR